MVGRLKVAVAVATIIGVVLGLLLGMWLCSGREGSVVVVFEFSDEQGRVIGRNTVVAQSGGLPLPRVTGIIPGDGTTTPSGPNPNELYLTVSTFVRVKFSVKGDAAKYGFIIIPYFTVEGDYYSPSTGALLKRLVFTQDASEEKYEFEYVRPVDGEEIQLEVKKYTMNVGDGMRKLGGGVIAAGKYVFRVRFKAIVKMYVIDRSGKVIWLGEQKATELVIAEQPITVWPDLSVVVEEPTVRTEPG